MRLMKSLQNLGLEDSKIMCDQQREFVLGACETDSIPANSQPSRNFSYHAVCVPVLLRQKTLTERVHCEFLSLFSKGINYFSAGKSHPL